MWFPKKSSSTFGMVMGIALSLGSFVAIHAGFMWLHEFVDDATPRNAVAYAFDRGLEHTERWMARAKGTVSTIETYTDHAAERMDELEHLLSEDTASGAHVDHLEELLVDTRVAMEKSVGYLEDHAKGQADDLKMFTLALFVESTVSDITRRLEKTEELVQAADKQLVTDAVPAMAVLTRRATAVASLFDVEATVAEAIRADVQTQIVTRRAPSSTMRTVPDSPGGTPACGKKNAPCQTNKDCCEGEELYCTQVFVADGSRVKRCMKQT